MVPLFCTNTLEDLVLVPCFIETVYSIVVNPDKATVSTVVAEFVEMVDVVTVKLPPPPDAAAHFTPDACVESAVKTYVSVPIANSVVVFVPVPITIPPLVLAVTPFPPRAISIAVPCQVPDVIVPTVVSAEVVDADVNIALPPTCAVPRILVVEPVVEPIVIVVVPAVAPVPIFTAFVTAVATAPFAIFVVEARAVGLIVIVPADIAVPPSVIVPDVIAPPIEIEPDVIPVFQRAAVPVVVKDVFIVSIVGFVIVALEPNDVSEEVVDVEVNKVAPVGIVVVFIVIPERSVIVPDPALIAIG